MDSMNYFKPVMSQSDEQYFLHLLRVFQKAAETNNVTYLLVSGSAIGARRHHGMIPWDDDIDILVNHEHRETLDRALSQLTPQFELHKRVFPFIFQQQWNWKFCFATKGRTYLLNAFRWPYLDIFFYADNSTHLLSVKKVELLAKVDVFPLKRVPFGPIISRSFNIDKLLWIPSPCRIRFESAANICTSRSFSHIMEFPIFPFFQRTVSCSLLKNDYPFTYMVQEKTADLHYRNFDRKGLSVEFQELRLGRRIFYRLGLEQPLCDGHPKGSPGRFQLKRVVSGNASTVHEFFASGFKLFW
ncbi:hypothetical protein P879_01694 [Paragonimus westermani]|uniref:LicD/FKTN/FKRP nucleotidyltransferase domain-containing protein n=1 Tax=Paragonimus westermani TaxID=34504 RepID=A0A8T0DK89_9TREM|nr:hypothetical protein P879_01694 [Paragonimus westermani]